MDFSKLSMKDRVILVLALLVLGTLIWGAHSSAGHDFAASAAKFTAQKISRDELPVHPTTQQLLDWNNRCANHDATVETCQRVQQIAKAKAQVCISRMDARDLVMTGINQMNPQQLLDYCDQRFPDLR